jgi:DNA polymerase III delta prime subunit
MTYRDRREAKADRLREWAEKREVSASAVLASHEIYRGDIAFNTQPGHIPLRARVIAQDDRAFESLAKAREMTQRADNIEAAAANAIYSDDPDAIERLTEKLTRLEAEREQVKSENAAFRKVHRAELKLLTAYGRDQAMPHRAYVGTNLSGVISNTRKRLEQLQRSA